uniref:T-cell surface glycoprotein CD4-like n=1 Tax=Haplochromis burtoni TaxID=8153 RepID=A0A3Q2X7E9_HAPBU
MSLYQFTTTYREYYWFCLHVETFLISSFNYTLIKAEYFLTVIIFFSVLGALSAAGEDLIAKVGQKVTLNCGVNSYRKSLQWLHGNDVLFTVGQTGFTRKGTAELVQRSVVRQTNLEISSVRETDAGRFTCLADGTRHEHSLVVFSVSVSPSAVLKPNDEATLQCEVKGQPHGCEVKWQSPNTDSPTNPSTVQLKPVTSSHNGAWECIVTCGSNNGFYRVLHYYVVISVKTSPLCSLYHSPTAAAKPKQGRRREKPSALPLHPA